MELAAAVGGPGCSKDQKTDFLQLQGDQRSSGEADVLLPKCLHWAIFRSRTRHWTDPWSVGQLSHSSQPPGSATSPHCRPQRRLSDLQQSLKDTNVFTGPWRRARRAEPLVNARGQHRGGGVSGEGAGAAEGAEQLRCTWGFYVKAIGKAPGPCESFETSFATIVKHFSLYYLFHNS